jgi:hypothetical protein
VQHIPAFQNLLLAFVKSHRETLSFIAIPIGPERMRERLDFIISLCESMPNLKKLALLQGRDSRGPVGDKHLVSGEVLLSVLLDNLTTLQRPIESFTLIDVASPFTPEVGKLFGPWTNLKHLRLGDRNNSIPQNETAEEQHQSGNVKFISYDLMSFIQELPPSLETLVLTITSGDARLSNSRDFGHVCQLGDSIFRTLHRLHSCDIIAWIGDYSSLIEPVVPETAINFRRLPCTKVKIQNPKIRTLWTSRFSIGAKYLSLRYPHILHQNTTLKLGDDDGEFAGGTLQASGGMVLQPPVRRGIILLGTGAIH